MLLLLLITLIPYSQAQQVCFNFTSYDIEITVPNAKLIDKPVDFVNCSYDFFNVTDCHVDCDFAHKTNSSWFNGSSGCIEATTENEQDGEVLRTIIYMKNEPGTICTLVQCTNASITELLCDLKVDMKGLMDLYYIRTTCSDFFVPGSIFLALRKSYVKKEKQIIHMIMETSTSNFTNHDLKDIGMNVINMTGEDLDTDEAMINVAAAKLLPQNESCLPEILFPANALPKISPSKRVFGTVSYMTSEQFVFGPVNISSMVIRIEVLDETRLQHLDPPIQMVFRNLSQAVAKNKYVCHYFNEEEFKWLTHGCVTNISSDNDVICSCNHMTPFAVLLMKTTIEPIHWKILSIISYIGCGLSAFFTALSIVIFLFSHKKADHSISIHVSLSGALFLLNITFLLTEWGASVKPAWVCVFVAVAMHYSLLCSFTWMALEAVHLYLLLIKVFNTIFKKYMLKLSAIGWGLPAIIVSVSVAVKGNFYGMTETVMADSNQTSAICWITNEPFFYSVNLVYFAVIFIFNSGILMAVASSICKMKQVFRNVKMGKKSKSSEWIDRTRFNESCKSGLTVLGLTCLTGTTWGLAFLGSGYVNYPVLYLFCIFNSTQGFFIFIWICLSTNKQRKREREDKMTSALAKTSTTKTE